MIPVQLAILRIVILLYIERNSMVKMYVDIDKFDEMPQWAKNYFKSNCELLMHIELCKKTKRKEFMEVIASGLTFSYIKGLISANNRGKVFFYWEDPQDLTKFLLEWA